MTVLTLVSTDAASDIFSCGLGGRKMCVKSGETICSTYDKCVPETSTCFEFGECNYEGFTCTSNLTECANAYETLANKYNALFAERDELEEELNDAQSLNSILELVGNSKQVEEFRLEIEALKEENLRMESIIATIQFCLKLAAQSGNVTDQQACAEY